MLNGLVLACRMAVALAVLGLCQAFVLAEAPASPQPAAEKIELPTAPWSNLLGDPVALAEWKDRAALVLIFVGHNCPISNQYAPEILRLQREFAKQKVLLCVVYSNPRLTEAAARLHAQEYGWEFPALLDPSLTLAQAVEASVQPEAVVILPPGEIAYRGRIDNRYVSYGKRREVVTQRDLHAAIQAVLAGEPVPEPRTKAIGCPLELPAKQEQANE